MPPFTLLFDSCACQRTAHSRCRTATEADGNHILEQIRYADEQQALQGIYARNSRILQDSAAMTEQKSDGNAADADCLILHGSCRCTANHKRDESPEKSARKAEKHAESPTESRKYGNTHCAKRKIEQICRHTLAHSSEECTK